MHHLGLWSVLALCAIKSGEQQIFSGTSLQLTELGENAKREKSRFPIPLSLGRGPTPHGKAPLSHPIRCDPENTTNNFVEWP